jgi:glycosyltransferase involved in cell wall biosynthesis
MKLSVITCTADRPWAIKQAETLMKRQTRQPDEWVVADDGTFPAQLTCNQIHVTQPRNISGPVSLANNMLAALSVVTGDIIVVVEDDDWYHPAYLETCAKRLQTTGATGDRILRYYHVPQRIYITMNNRGSALAQTSLRREYLPFMQKAAMAALTKEDYNIDSRFWSTLASSDYTLHNDGQVIGMKGLPGRQGLGIGHRPNHKRPWRNDPTGKMLRHWLGEEAEAYLAL